MTPGRYPPSSRAANIGPIDTSNSPSPSRVVYGLDDRPPLREALPLGLQHLVAMILSNVAVPLIIARGIGVSPADTAVLVQMVLVMAGLATIVQAFPVGPIGGRIPIVMGTSVAFAGALIAVGRQYGLPTVFGACLAAASVEVVLGLGLKRVRHWFPPLVNGIVVMLIGLTLIPVGVDFAAGGIGAADYGDPLHLGVAALVLVAAVALQQWGRGFASYGSIFLAIALGCGVALALGRFDLGAVTEADWWSLPRPLTFGLEFHWQPIVVVAFLYVVSTMETLGDIAGTLAVAGREPTTRELRGGLLADGVMSALAAVWSAFPNTSYSQNVGLVNFTGVASRHVTAVTGGLLCLMGLVPKFGALFAAIPASVIGGAGLVLFAMIFTSGARMVHEGEAWNQRTLVIMAVSIGLGLGIELRPDALGKLPGWAQEIFGAGLITGGLAALLLQRVLPRRHDD